MTTSLPKFIVEKRSIRTPSKIAAKAAQAAKKEVNKPDHGTVEFRRRVLESDLAHLPAEERELWFSGKRKGIKVGVIQEPVERAASGAVTKTRVRVENSFPHDRYKSHKQLDPHNVWQNIRLWDAAERLREDFEVSGVGPKTCSSFVPRAATSDPYWQPELSIKAEKNYKKAMKAISNDSLRSSIYWVCIAGEYADSWARRNDMIPQAGLPILRIALTELAQHYGFVKKDVDSASRRV